MKISIQLPTGLEITFDGDQADFKLFQDAYPELPELLRATEPGGSPEPSASDPQNAHHVHEEAPPSSRTGVDVRVLDARLSEVNATTDIERVAVMAQAAVDAGLPSLDYQTADRLFEDLGLRKPAKMRAAFQNAKSRGLVRSVGQGTWRPTVAGENFARYGRKPARRASRSSASSPAEGDS
jgi:hypothetical protein